MSESNTETEELVESGESESEAPEVALGIDEEVVKSIPITLNVEVGNTKLKLRGSSCGSSGHSAGAG